MTAKTKQSGPHIYIPDEIATTRPKSFAFDSYMVLSDVTWFVEEIIEYWIYNFEQKLLFNQK